MWTVRVQVEDFDAGAEGERLQRVSPEVGAVVSFVGTVRGGEVRAMTLEHYPGMTEKSLEALVEEARRRWSLVAATVIHRVGRLMPGERIVFVGVASRHRSEAFAACEFLIDRLKTEAPFWKKEETNDSTRWVEAKEGDEARARRW
ncbi:molybdenum cofactor biosynthesis protein MoaE [Tepidiphilus margaritifer]|uniref:molybdenum cofactor biosynthesis protein MoaE n=1 Tax=Tepidiphilus margaritifer TaxID=203471 RepID=UPI00048C0F9F|nr:molybdenum cofactor biosynthesis protein MoaE [Tepidiphilus margaritifer]